jgi:hypothetical protein
MLFQCYGEADFAIGRFLVEKHSGQQTVQGFVRAELLEQVHPPAAETAAVIPVEE